MAQGSPPATASQPPHHSGEPLPLVGVDTGGTFTDLVAWEGGRLRSGKVLSTPDDPSRAIIEGLERLGLHDRPVVVIHGTTVGTNAVLEGKGARVAYVTSKGFADILALARQNRHSVYRLEQPREAPPVPTELCLEISTRCDADGNFLGRADDAELAELVRRLDELDAKAVAVNLLFAFLCGDEERRIRQAIGPGRFVSLASEVLPEIREYERGIATWLNASVGPVIERYLERLAAGLPEASLSVMQSSGTTVAAERAAAGAVRLLLSGPAGGIAAARLIGEVTGHSRLLTLDMGGTSTDVSLLDGDIPLTNRSRIAGWPLTVPSVDIHTIGAGGGSLARVDEGGMLLVGPESAGAAPGPACYGQGGAVVTVTDANVVLGRIPADTRLGGYLPIDTEAANDAMDRLADELGSDRVTAAAGVLRIADEHMARALRVMSVERGHDPREHALLCFGGAGGLHACSLADLLGMDTVLLPTLGGVLSAHGMLASEPGRDLSRAVLEPLGAQTTDGLDDGFAALEKEAVSSLEDEVADRSSLKFLRRLELRYEGQSAALMVDFGAGAGAVPDAIEAFHLAHERDAGHRLDRAVELVNLRLSARAPAPMTSLVTQSEAMQDPTLEQRHSSRQETARTSYLPDLGRSAPVIERAEAARQSECSGPCIVVDEASTVWVAPGWRYEVDSWGNLLLQRT